MKQQTGQNGMDWKPK